MYAFLSFSAPVFYILYIYYRFAMLHQTAQVFTVLPMPERHPLCQFVLMQLDVFIKLHWLVLSKGRNHSFWNACEQDVTCLVLYENIEINTMPGSLWGCSQYKCSHAVLCYFALQPLKPAWSIDKPKQAIASSITSYRDRNISIKSSCNKQSECGALITLIWSSISFFLPTLLGCRKIAPLANPDLLPGSHVQTLLLQHAVFPSGQQLISQWSIPQRRQQPKHASNTVSKKKTRK